MLPYPSGYMLYVINVLKSVGIDSVDHLSFDATYDQICFKDRGELCFLLVPKKSWTNLQLLFPGQSNYAEGDFYTINSLLTYLMEYK